MIASSTLQMVRSPEYVTEGDIPISIVDHKLIVTLSDLHMERCTASCTEEPVIQEVNNSLTRILNYYRKNIEKAGFNHYGAMWGFPETDSIEVEFVNGRKTQYLLDRDPKSSALSHYSLKHIPDAINEKLQDEL